MLASFDLYDVLIILIAALAVAVVYVIFLGAGEDLAKYFKRRKRGRRR